MLGDSSECNLEEPDDSDVDEFFDDDDYEDDAQSNMEENELFSHTEFSNTIDVGKIIAIYSGETVNKRFFLCRVIEKGHTDEQHISDDNDHHIPAMVLIIWLSIILKKPLTTFNQELLITKV